MVVSNDSIKNATATSHGNKRRLDVCGEGTLEGLDMAGSRRVPKAYQSAGEAATSRCYRGATFQVATSAFAPTFLEECRHEYRHGRLKAHGRSDKARHLRRNTVS
jgi:hypothetical protein